MDNQFTADNIGKLKNIVKRNAGPAGILFLLYLAAALPLLSADFYYRDDLRRAATGFRGWEVGRYLSLLGSVILHTDTYLADISPLPQLAALVILAVSAVMLRRVIGRERRFGFWDCAALFPVAFFPHFLNCLSYKYDAPYMALSIGVSIAPLLFRRCRRSVYCAGVFVGTLAMCMLYQASSGIFPVIVAYLVMTGDPAGRSGEKKPGDGEIMTEDTAGGSGKKRRGAVNEGLAFAAWSAAFYVLAMVFFRLFIMQPLSDYVSTELAEPGALFSVLAGNYREYFRLFFSDLRLPWLVLLALITALFLVDRIVRAKGSRVVAFFLTLAGTACMFLFCLGAYPFLAKPLFQPRAMYGLGFPFILMGLQLCLEEGRQWAGKLAVLALSFCFFVFSYVYGNALDVQARYTDFRAGAAIADLTALEEFAGDGEKVLELAGNIRYSPLIEAMPEEYTLLRRLVPMTLGKGSMWRSYGFMHYYGLSHVTQDSTLELKSMDLPVLTETTLHRIQGDGKYFLITFL